MCKILILKALATRSGSQGAVMLMTLWAKNQCHITCVYEKNGGGPFTSGGLFAPLYPMSKKGERYHPYEFTNYCSDGKGMLCLEDPC